jgi:hypothetical protein
MPRRGSRRAAFVGWAIVGALVGLLAGLVPPVAGTEPSTTTTTLATAVSRFPPGYEDLGGDLGLRVEWVALTDDGVAVGVSAAIRNDDDRTPEDIVIGATGIGDTRRSVGLWTLTLTDGTATDGVEAFDDDAPGVVTVLFDTGPIELTDVKGLAVSLPVQKGSRVINSHMATPTFPVDSSNALDPIVVTELVDQSSGTVARSGTTTLVVDHLTVDVAAGAIEWHLEGDPTVRAFVEATVDLSRTDGTTTRLYPATRRPLAYLQRNSQPVSPAAAGTVQLQREQGTGLYTAGATEMDLQWLIGWARYDPAAGHALDLSAALAASAG